MSGLTALVFIAFSSPFAAFLPLTSHRSPLTVLHAQIAADDTTTIDTSEQDTVSTTERYLKEQLQENVRVPVHAAARR